MPPRIPIIQCLRTSTAQRSPATWIPFYVTSRDASTVAQRRKHRDPYAIAQAKARKAANLSRQEVLKQERAASLGDPIRGVETPFLQSFDTGIQKSDEESAGASRVTKPTKDKPLGAITASDKTLNFYLNETELDRGIKHSSWLLSPLETDQEVDESSIVDHETGRSLKEEDRKRTHEEQATAAEALQRIASLSIGSSKDLLRVNKQRCIETFGRHNTDTVLPPKPPGVHSPPKMQKKERAGPDTGSSEVQVAILTAKIRTLDQYITTRGRTDRVNQRNLRLLVHRRQKHLQYLRRKERGGPRWQKLIETLGLTEGTWQGEITLGRENMVPQ